LIINYATYKFPGKFEKFVTVFTDEAGGTNDKGEKIGKQYKIDITGYVKPIPMGVLEVEPRKVELGNLKIGTTTTYNLPIKNAGDADMKVSKVFLKKQDKDLLVENNLGELTIKPGETVYVACPVTSGEEGSYLEYVFIYSDARNVTEKGFKIVLIATFTK